MNYYTQAINTVIGRLTLISRDNNLTHILFPGQPIPGHIHHSISQDKQPIIDLAAFQLFQYFACERKQFELDFMLEGSAFQKKVWQQLRQIPYGKTISYEDLALKVGTRNHTRAVGTANSKNPIPIIIPCHRVINKNGRLGGYAGGLDIKQKLLQIEQGF